MRRWLFIDIFSQSKGYEGNGLLFGLEIPSAQTAVPGGVAGGVNLSSAKICR